MRGNQAGVNSRDTGLHRPFHLPLFIMRLNQAGVSTFSSRNTGRPRPFYSPLFIMRLNQAGVSTFNSRNTGRPRPFHLPLFIMRLNQAGVSTFSSRDTGRPRPFHLPLFIISENNGIVRGKYFWMKMLGEIQGNSWKIVKVREIWNCLAISQKMFTLHVLLQYFIRK